MLLAGENESAPSAPGRQELDVPAAWLRLALDAGAPEFPERLLDLLLEQGSAVGGGLWLLARTSRGNGLSFRAGRSIPQDDPAWTAWLAAQVRALFAARRTLIVERGPEQSAWSAEGPFLFLPLAWEGAGIAVALLTAPLVSSAAAGRLSTLAGWALNLHLRSQRADSPQDERACTEALLASAHSTEWPGVLAAHLRRHSGAWRASLLRETAGRWELVAVSGTGEISRRTAESRAIEQSQARLTAGRREAAHREGNVVSLRLGESSGWSALLEFEQGHTPDEAQLQRGLAGLIRVGERILPQVPRRGWRLALARRLMESPRLIGPRGSRWVSLGLIAFLVILACLPVRESFDGDCELQPAKRYTVVAEVEGRVKTVNVAEGSLVSAGQPLATLDVSALQTRLEVVRELRQEQEAEARRQQGLQDMTAYRMARLKVEQYAQEELSLSEDLRRSTLAAPIDGKILSKDLAQKQGTVLRLGDTLCEVGGLDAWDLQIALAEDDLEPFLRALSRAGRLPVSYRLKAGSTQVLHAEVRSAQQLSEMAYPVAGSNVLYITIPGVAIPPELMRDLRPGFSGRARIDGLARPWALTLTRRAVQWLRLHWWI